MLKVGFALGGNVCDEGLGFESNDARGGDVLCEASPVPVMLDILEEREDAL